MIAFEGKKEEYVIAEGQMGLWSTYKVKDV